MHWGWNGRKNIPRHSHDRNTGEEATQDGTGAKVESYPIARKARLKTPSKPQIERSLKLLPLTLPFHPTSRNLTSSHHLNSKLTNDSNDDNGKAR